MTDKQRIEELESLLLSLDSTFADVEVAKRKGYYTRDIARVRAEADRIYAKRRAGHEND